jgi:putative ABC transport system permease protein
MLKNHLRNAWRTLTRHKGYTLINILGLSLSLCACLTIYTITHYEFSFDDFHPDKNRIYRVGGKGEENFQSKQNAGTFHTEDIPPPAPAAIRAEVPGIETVAPYFVYDDATVIATDGYFHILPYDWLAGNPHTALSEPNAIVLTESQALKHFGRHPAADYLNKPLTIDDSLHLQVTGVIKDWTGNTDFTQTQFISFPTINHTFLHNRFHPENWAISINNPCVRTLIKLKPHTDPTSTESQIAAVMDRHHRADTLLNLIRFRLIIQPLKDIHFNADFSHDGARKAHLPALYALIGAAAFILLLAIVNYINLSTAISLRRAKEIGVRKVLGGSKLRLIGRFLFETGLITGLSAILALLLVQPVLNAFHSYIPTGVHFNPLSPYTLTFAAAIAFITTILAGIYPARLLASQAPITHQIHTPANRRSYIRKALIIFQFTISGSCIIGSIAAGRQLHYMLDADMGLATNSVITVYNWNSQTDLRHFAAKARQLPGITGLTLQSYAPAAGGIIEQPIRMDGKESTDLFVKLQGADQNFVNFYHLNLVAGHNLPAGDSLNGFIINATYCHSLGFINPADAIGHSLSINGTPPWPIVGVIADFHQTTLRAPIVPLLIGHLTNLENSLAIRLTNIRQTLPRLESQWKVTTNAEPFHYTFLDESIKKLYQDDRQLSWLVRASTAVTIFISCMGLIGLVTFMAEQRKKEIAIRKVLGARITDITTLLSRDFLVLVGIALLIATPIASIFLHRWLETYAYRINLSWPMFALAGALTLLITIATIALRILTAALQNPIENLRSE